MEPNGRIVTFYSYKGGVGRTFILASVAVTLAEWGRNVLCLDWDLEAPGLTHYFGEWLPELPGGLVDIVEQLGSNDYSRPDWRDHVVSIDIPGQPRIDLLPAGRAENYTERLQRVDWESLYDSSGLGDFLEVMRDEMSSAYDVVLVDSRTGVTDSGGICTVQLPDMLVMVLTANAQSLVGTLDIGTRIASARDALQFDRLRLPVLPLLSRFDGREERHLGEDWTTRVANVLGPLYEPWLPVGVEPRQVLERTVIPYVSYWSFGEGIPALEERASSPEMVSWSLETIAALIINGLGDVATLLANRDLFVSSARLQKEQHLLTYDIYLSCSRRDLKIGRSLAEELTASGLEVWFESDAARTGGTWTDRVQRGLASSRHLVVLVVGQVAKTQEQELRQFLLGLIDRTTDSRVLSVIGDGAERPLPPALASFPTVVLEDSIRLAASVVLRRLGLQGSTDPSDESSTSMEAADPSVSGPETYPSLIQRLRMSGSQAREGTRSPAPGTTPLGEATELTLRSGSSHTSIRVDQTVECPVCGLRVEGGAGFLRHLEQEHGARALAEVARPVRPGLELVVWAIQRTLHLPPVRLSAEKLSFLESRMEPLVEYMIAGEYVAAVDDLIRNTVLNRPEAEQVVDSIRRRIERQE